MPLVRVAENTPTSIQSMLDMGAHGVVVPHVDDAAGAQAAVASSRYAPRGRRGMCPACHGSGWSLEGWRERTETADEEVMVIPIIESRRAVNNIEAILAVEGVDMVHFGPGDLSADMGLDFNRERDRMDAAWRRCLDATRAAGKLMLAPAGLGYDDADVLIAPMELMLLRDLMGRMVRDHQGGTGETAMSDRNAFQVGPLPGDPPFGATVTGLTREAIADEAVRERLRALWIDRGVLVFRGLEGEDAQLELSRCFGRLIAHPTRETRAEHPELMTVHYRPEDGWLMRVDGEQRGSWLPWHSDLIYVDRISRGGILRPVRLPNRLGQTGSIDKIAAYASLPRHLKDRIEGLEIVYEYDLDPAGSGSVVPRT